MTNKFVRKNSALNEFVSGLKDGLPLQIGVIPFGIVFGIVGLEVGLSPLQTFLMSSILFGGASQIVFTQLHATATPFAVLVATVSAVNLRHLLYGMVMSEYLRHLPLKWRLALGYLLTDEAFAVSHQRYTQRPTSDFMHYHLLGSGLMLWFCWQVSTAIGILSGPTIPESFQLGFAIPLTFIAVIIPSLTHFPAIFSAISAGLAALIFQFLPFNLWLIVAAFCGIMAGTLSSYVSKNYIKKIQERK